MVQRYRNTDDEDLIFAWYRLEEGQWVGRDIGVDALEGEPKFVGDMTTADLDHDGDLDVLIPNESSGPIPVRARWFENPGDLSSPWTGYPIDLRSGSHRHAGDIEVGDLDGDGLLDIVVRDLGGSSPPGMGWVHIAFQNALPQDFTVRSLELKEREGLKLGDLDRDGDLDLVFNGFWWETPADPRTGAFTEYVIDKTERKRRIDRSILVFFLHGFGTIRLRQKLLLFIVVVKDSAFGSINAHAELSGIVGACDHIVLVTQSVLPEIEQRVVQQDHAELAAGLN